MTKEKYMEFINKKENAPLRAYIRLIMIQQGLLNINDLFEKGGDEECQNTTHLTE